VVERRETFLAHQSVARGSERWVNVTTATDPRLAVEPLRRDGFTLIATHPEGDLSVADLERSEGKVALVLGNERDGISEALRGACDRSVRVPMRGFAESLNVSVTAALLLFSLTRHRRGDLPEMEKNRLLARAFILSVPHAREVLEAKGYEPPVAKVS
jgi:tRNA (guanosine-2'-O-)-methyltransferase